jgi:hypothetical protein
MRLAVLLLAAIVPVAPMSVAQQVTPGSSPLTVVATAGPVSVTGTLTETNLAAMRIPAGSMGPNGAIDLKCVWSYTNSSNIKLLTTRFTTAAGSIGGGVIGSAVSATTSAAAQTEHVIRNNNATNAQSAFAGTGIGPFVVGAAAISVLTNDTTADTFLNVNGTLANTGETITLQHCIALVMRSTP